LFKELSEKETGLQYIESLIRYILSNVENMTGDKLKNIVSRSLPGKEGDVIMKFADSALGKEYHKGIQQGINQGIQKGIHQGILQGLRQGLKDTAFDLIDVRFPQSPEADHIKQRIQKIDDLDQLKALKEKIKTVESVSDLMNCFTH